LDWRRDEDSRANADAPTEFTRGDEPTWLTQRAGTSLEIISSDDTVAQVDPKKLCEFLLDECLKRGVTLHQPAKVVSVAKDARDELAGVRIVKADGMETDSMSVY
jgi:glycine/D-amino acid oxidase-like deaminating enzyme